ncbi:methyl-accepting chemotaxis protein [Acidocella sp.]|uniref:methyl-accepting chemotaxis protein n=1 Tax=Acidocella sp. TaxID=50710 RepID=UPI003CFF49BE
MSPFQALNERLSFSKLNNHLQDRLRSAKSIIMAAMPAALDASYAQIRATPDTARFFTSDAAVGQAKSKQSAHWDHISNGNLDETYARSVIHVGEVHARIGLEPRWYIGGYNIVLGHLLTALLEARWPESRLAKNRNQIRHQAIEEAVSITKVVMLDMDMAISAYLDKLDQEKQAAEARLRESAEAVGNAMGPAMAALASGNLTHRIGDVLPPEYAKLRDDFNAAMEKLSATLNGVLSASRTISGGVDELAHASDDMSRRTEQQAASLLESTTALNELTKGVKHMADGTAEATKTASTMNNRAENSRGVVAEAGAAMEQIEGSSREIGQIIGLIDDIAFQTNLLALNAGVEAARAGDAGRGFAVVASEVRALAQRSADAAKAIKSLISTSSSQVNQGVDLVRKTGTTLDGIISSVGQIDKLIADMASTATNQSGGLGEVNEALGLMNNTVQQNAAMVEESTAAVHSLRAEIEGLNRLLAAFKLSGTAAFSQPTSRASANRPSAANRPAAYRQTMTASSKPDLNRLSVPTKRRGAGEWSQKSSQQTINAMQGDKGDDTANPLALDMENATEE